MLGRTAGLECSTWSVFVDPVSLSVATYKALELNSSIKFRSSSCFAVILLCQSDMGTGVLQRLLLEHPFALSKSKELNYKSFDSFFVRSLWFMRLETFLG